MKRDVSRLFVEALADGSASRLRLSAIAGATAIVLAVTAGVAVLPALRPAARAHAAAAARVASVPPPTAPAAPAPAATPTPAPAPTSTPVSAAPPRPFSVAAAPTAPPAVVLQAARFSFEDGTTDGWGGTGHVTSLGNSAAVAHDGTHSLQVGLHSTGSGDLPYVSVIAEGAAAPAAGQTVTAWVFVPAGSISVQGKVFVQDTGFGWHQGPLVTLARGGWTRLAVTVPSGIEVNGLGAQFLCTPFDTSGTLYLDSVNWS